MSSRPSSNYFSSQDTRSAQPHYEPQPRTQSRPLYVEPERDRRDSSSTFFGNGGRSSTDYLAPRPQSAGYNRQSFVMQPEREEPVRWDGETGGEDEKDKGDEEWDVYADFNNSGRRLAERDSGNGQRPRSAYSTTQLPALRPQRPPTSALSTSDPTTPMEYVTVPALGPEWTNEELRDMTRSGKRENERFERTRKFRAWYRDQEGILGLGRWGTRKSLVWIVFGLCCVVGVLLAILLPRVPGIDVYGDTPFTAPADAPTPEFSRTPANFTWDAQITLRLDTSSQVALPLHLNSLDAVVYDIDTDVAVGTGTLNSISAPAKQYTPITMPLTFSYQAVNSSDTTWSTFRDACGPEWTGTTRPALNLRVLLYMHIAGLIGTPQTAVSISDVACPIVLPSNAP